MALTISDRVKKQIQREKALAAKGMGGGARSEAQQRDKSLAGPNFDKIAQARQRLINRKGKKGATEKSTSSGPQNGRPRNGLGAKKDDIMKGEKPKGIDDQKKSRLGGGGNAKNTKGATDVNPPRKRDNRGRPISGNAPVATTTGKAGTTTSSTGTTGGTKGQKRRNGTPLAVKSTSTETATGQSSRGSVKTITSQAKATLAEKRKKLKDRKAKADEVSKAQATEAERQATVANANKGNKNVRKTSNTSSQRPPEKGLTIRDKASWERNFDKKQVKRKPKDWDNMTRAEKNAWMLANPPY